MKAICLFILFFISLHLPAYAGSPCSAFLLAPIVREHFLRDRRWTDLHLAIATGDLTRVKELLRTRPELLHVGNTELVDSPGVPIQFAVRDALEELSTPRGSSEDLRTKVEEFQRRFSVGENVWRRDRANVQYLKYEPDFEKLLRAFRKTARERDNARIKILKMLIDAGANLEVKGLFQSSLLHSVRDVETAKVLLWHRPDLLEARDISGNTPLHNLVVYHGNKIELIAYLISVGANIHSENRNQDTPVFSAAYYDNAAFFEAIVKQSIPLNRGILNFAGQSLTDVIAEHRTIRERRNEEYKLAKMTSLKKYLLSQPLYK